MATYVGTGSDDILVSTNTTSLLTADTMTGLAGDDILIGGWGADTLDGGLNMDAMYGGIGNDIYIVDDANDTINENVSEGTDTVRSSISFSLAPFDNVENITLTGVTLNMVATGNDYNNVLDGTVSTVVNSLVGGLGNDTYILGNGADLVFENASEGTDTVSVTSTTANTTFSIASYANVENITLTGTTVLHATGDANVNVLTGNSAINTLNGGAGADTMIGGLGNDVYEVDDAGDVITELAAQGTDVVRFTTAVAGTTYTLGGNVENLTLLGINDINGVGSAVVNVLTGNSGNNSLDGGVGADTMSGLAGNDTYFVDNTGDKIINETSGTDTVNFSSATAGTTYTIVTGLENLTLGGINNINGTGNTGANVLTGNAGNNILNDGGAASVDTMIGGAGNDTYVVNNAGDVITELGGGGTSDLVNFTSTVAGTTYTLGAEIERLTLLGTAAINGTGNTLANVITGNGGANILNDGGVGGTDTLNGGAGNDTYVVYNAADVLIDSGGSDTVQFNATANGQTFTLATGLENLTLLGGFNSNATGNTSNNILIGDAGNNSLDGGNGNDVLKGGAGNDTYVVSVSGDIVVEFNGQGTDSVLSTATSYTLSAYIENLTLGGVGNINGNGNAQDNVIHGNVGNNILNGSGGTDTLTYANAAGGITMDLSLTTLQVTGGAGNDTVSNFENLTGSAFNDTLTGTSGNNVIEGGDGDDLMTGNGGTDTASYSTASAGVTVDLSDGSAQNTGGAGTDTLSGFVNVTGSAFDDVLTGTSGNNVMDGGAGTGDTVSYANAVSGVNVDLSVLTAQVTGAGTDTLANFENLTGSAFDDLLFGDSGNNTLDGGGDVFGDFLFGGGGTDTYVIRTGDEIVIGGAGTDTATSSLVSIDLTNGNFTSVENATLTGASNLDLTGDGNANVLTGNTGMNTIDGAGGNDTIDGGTGADDMTGGMGDDTFYVDNAGDVVTEAGAGGTADLVISSIDFDLQTDGANVENLTLTGTALIGTGDDGVDNIITGNAQGNTLNGRTGSDTLIGGDGDDLYIVQDAGDVVDESGTGTADKVKSDFSYTLGANVEQLELSGAPAFVGTGNGLDNLITVSNFNGVSLYGMGGDDTIIGGGAADTIDGGDGNDLLTGGLDVDVFALTVAPNASTNVDTITDFDPTAVTGDVLDISAILTGGPSDPTGYVDFVTNGGDTEVYVDADGGADGYVLAAVLQGVTGLDGTEIALEAAGTLVI